MTERKELSAAITALPPGGVSMVCSAATPRSSAHFLTKAYSVDAAGREAQGVDLTMLGRPPGSKGLAGAGSALFGDGRAEN